MMKAKMQMEIEVNGKTYWSAVEEVDSIREVASSFKDAIMELSSLFIHLEDGSYLILGEDAIKSSAFLIKAVE